MGPWTGASRKWEEGLPPWAPLTKQLPAAPGKPGQALWAPWDLEEKQQTGQALGRERVAAGVGEPRLPRSGTALPTGLPTTSPEHLLF